MYNCTIFTTAKNPCKHFAFLSFWTLNASLPTITSKPGNPVKLVKWWYFQKRWQKSNKKVKMFQNIGHEMDTVFRRSPRHHCGITWHHMLALREPVSNCQDWLGGLAGHSPSLAQHYGQRSLVQVWGPATAASGTTTTTRKKHTLTPPSPA